MTEKKVTYKHGFFFPIGGLLFGGFILIIGLPILINPSSFIHFCIGTAVAFIGLLFFSTKGLDINLETKNTQEYTRVLGLKVGKSTYLSNYKYICIINQGYVQSVFPSLVVEVKHNFSTYNLLLLNDTHHLKQFVASFDNLEDAQAEANKLAEILHFEIVKYDPVRTRGRRK